MNIYTVSKFYIHQVGIQLVLPTKFMTSPIKMICFYSYTFIRMTLNRNDQIFIDHFLKKTGLLKVYLY